jgi:hypothetical protein
VWNFISDLRGRTLIYKRVQRRIFSSMRDEIMGDWKKLHNNELHNNLYSSPNIIKMIVSKRQGA